MGPKEWLREQKQALEGVKALEVEMRAGKSDSPYAAAAWEERMRRAFEPVVRYLGELAKGEVKLESDQWPAGERKAGTILRAPLTGAVEDRIVFRGETTMGNGKKEVVEWGFGIRVLPLRRLRPRFEVFDFGVSGQRGTGGPASQVFAGSEEALRVYLGKIEDHMVGIEGLEI